MDIGINLEKLLSAWNIRCMMIVSFGVQIFLTFAAPYRRNTSRGFTAIIIWSAYLLADWSAIYAFGLISNTIRASSEVNVNILALWASFLLIHMGGPDTITAYSLEDNSLWLRHLVRLVGQLAVFSYIFIKTFPGNNLAAPTALVLTTGVVKSGERMIALFLASLDNLKSSIDKQSITKQMQQTWPQHYFFERFRGMIVDIMPSPSELEQSREFFKTTGAEGALMVISKELNIIYQVLYTKIMAIESKWGIFSRSVFYVSMVAALVLFCLSSKDQFDGVDVRITYCLLVGVFVVDISRTVMRVESNWADWDTDVGGCSLFLDVLLTALTAIPSAILYCLCLFLCLTMNIDSKLWSEDMGAFNLLDCSIWKYCRLRKKRKDSVTRFCRDVLDKAIDGCGLTDRIDEMMHTRRNDFNPKLWEFIFDALKRKELSIHGEEQAREAYESKGESVLLENNLRELKKDYVEDFDYDKGVLCWHVATEICYNVDEDESDGYRGWSKILSDYLMYLMIHRPKLMGAVIGRGHERYAGTCLEVKDLANKLGVENLKEFCTKVLERGNVHEYDDEEKNDPENRGCGVEDKSTLADGRDLARILMKCNDKWKIIAGVWAEMLSYAAGHCRGDAHARAVSEGGELLTHVWLLMAHFGITAHWSKTEWSNHKKPTYSWFKFRIYTCRRPLVVQPPPLFRPFPGLLPNA